jgi:hypothetical protein
MIAKGAMDEGIQQLFMKNNPSKDIQKQRVSWSPSKRVVAFEA